jgi:predicted glycosyltransferase
MAGSRFVFCSHDGVSRDLAIAAALTEADGDASVLLVSGRGDLGARPLPPGVDLVALPGDRALQAVETNAIVESFHPDALLVDEPALASLPQWDGRTALGLPDVIEAPADGVIAFMQDRCERLLVYGNAGAVDFAGEYGLPRSLGARIRYCGYVVEREPAADGWRLAPSPRVVACADAGADGQALLDVFAAAARAARWDAVMIAGPDSRRADRALLQRSASDAGMEFRASVEELRMADFDVLVCTGGYDTLTEALRRGTPTVCVPCAHPRTEQLIRARAFADLGLLRLVEPWRLNAELLRGEVAALLGADRREIVTRAHASLGFDGARMAARELLELAEHPLGLSDRAWLSSG